jgi:alpha-beta hydrolase superfamily lysophospholipase
MTWVIRGVARLAPLRALGLPESTIYGDSLHASKFGEWDFDIELKPLGGFPVTIGWLSAVRRGHARLHRGLDVGVPSLVLRSDKTHYARERSDASDRADTVLDVRQIARWAGCLGDRTTVVPIHDARHDVFLSLPEPRAAAYAAVDDWLRG